MEPTFSKEQMILASRCDSTGRLGISDCFDLFMDAATEHAEDLDGGFTALGRKNQFWITVKTRIDFLRRPGLTETVTVTTWPEKPEGMRGMRDYVISAGGKTLAVGKSLWAVLDLKTGRPVNLKGIYPPELDLRTDTAVEEPFRRIADDFDGAPFAEYRIRGTDIDIGGHMNNVAYVRAFESLFTTKEWNELDPASFEVQFKSSCYEGEILEFRKKEADGLIYVKASVGDRTAILMAIRPAGG